MNEEVKVAESGQTLTICLYVEHKVPDMANSMYMITLPTDLSKYDQLKDFDSFMADSNSIAPFLTFPKYEFLENSEFVKLGSIIYFLGGHCYEKFDSSKSQYNMFLKKDDKLTRAVYCVDTSKHQQTLRPVASMNAPKQNPCVFVADGMIYALGTALRDRNSNSTPKGMDCFERYDPISDQWEVLPDPPLPSDKLFTTTWSGRATVVGREVLVGSDGSYAIYNLDSQKWGEVPPENLAERFPYGSLYVNGSLYHLRGGSVWHPGSVWDLDSEFSALPIQIVKRGPFTSKDAWSLLESDCLDPKTAQVMANARTLDDDDKFRFTQSSFKPWRSLIHLGDLYFCYVVTAQLVDCEEHTIVDQKCRCIGIKVFKEVQRENKEEFQLIASFFYKIRTEFRNRGFNIRCCALGTVPECKYFLSFYLFL